MAGDTRDITLDVTVRARDEGSKKASRALSDVEREAALAGKSMHGMSDESKLLDAQIVKSTARLKELEKALALGGDDHEIRKAIRSERSWIAELEKSAKDLMPDVEQAGAAVGTVFSSGIGAGFKDAPIGPALIAGLVGAALAAAPTLGAIVAGSITGVVGVGGIAGGIFAASRDSRVKAAAQDLGQSLQDEFFGTGSNTFAPALVGAIRVLKTELGQVDLGSLFANSAPFVADFAKSIGGFAKEFLPGFTQAVRDASPALRTFDAYLPIIGKDLGLMFDKIATSKGAVEGAMATMNLLDFTVRELGSGIAILGGMFDVTNRATAQFAGAEASLFDTLGMHTTAGFFKFWETGSNNLVTHDIPHAVGAFHELDRAMAGTVDSVDKLDAPFAQLRGEVAATTDAIGKFIGVSLSLDQAQTAQKQAILDLGQAIKENGAHWDDNTQAAIANHQALDSAVQAIMATRDAEVAHGTSVFQANIEYDASIEKLKALAVQMGMSKAQAEAFAKTYQIKFVVTTVYDSVQALGAKIGGILGSLGFNTGARASGGPVTAGQPYVVGEKRPELFVPSQNGYIMPSVPGGGGATNVIVSVAPGADSAFAAYVMKMLRFEVRTLGGPDAAFS